MAELTVLVSSLVSVLLATEADFATEADSWADLAALVRYWPSIWAIRFELTDFLAAVR